MLDPTYFIIFVFSSPCASCQTDGRSHAAALPATAARGRGSVSRCRGCAGAAGSCRARCARSRAEARTKDAHASGARLWVPPCPPVCSARSRRAVWAGIRLEERAAACLRLLSRGATADSGPPVGTAALRFPPLCPHHGKPLIFCWAGAARRAAGPGTRCVSHPLVPGKSHASFCSGGVCSLKTPPAAEHFLPSPL